MKFGKDCVKIFILIGKAIVGLGSLIAALTGIKKEWKTKTSHKTR